MINISNPDYFEEVSILRATQMWQQENKAEESISQSYQFFLEQIKRELSDLYAQYGEEGLLNYSILKRKLNPTELRQYKTLIENIYNQYGNMKDEELYFGLRNLTEFNDLSILDSKMNLLEAYLIVMVSNNIEIVTESLSQTYQYSYTHSLYDIHRRLGFVIPFERLNRNTIRESIVSNWSGDTFIDAIKHSRHGLVRDIKKAIVKGIRRNETYQRVVKGLDKLVSGGKGYKSIRSILRTESTRVITEATAKSYEQAGVRKYRYVATLDNRTTGICRNKDSEVYLLKDLEVGVNAPPLHTYCRSTISVFNDEDDLSKLERIARDPKTGQNYKIPANLSYKEWNEKYNK